MIVQHVGMTYRSTIVRYPLHKLHYKGTDSCIMRNLQSFKQNYVTKSDTAVSLSLNLLTNSKFRF